MFPQRLRFARKLRNLSQESLAKKLNTTKSTISNYENNYSSPSNDTLIDISRTLDITTDFLLGLSDIPNHKQLNNNLDSRVVELDKLLKSLPEGEEEIYIERIKAYIDGMIHASKNKTNR